MPSSFEKKNKEEELQARRESLETEKEVERMASSFQGRRRETDGKTNSRDRSHSSVRVSKSATDNSKDISRDVSRDVSGKPSRSKSESRMKDNTHRTFSEAKEKLKKQATGALSKTETGRKVVKAIEKASDVAAEVKEVVKAVKGDAWQSEDSDEGGAVGGMDVTNDSWGARDLIDLGDQFERMEISPNQETKSKTRRGSGREREEMEEADEKSCYVGFGENQDTRPKSRPISRKRSEREREVEGEDDDEMSLPPRKMMTPEPRPLSSIEEDQNGDSDEEEPSRNRAERVQFALTCADQLWDKIDQSKLEIAERDGIIANMRSQHIQTLAIIEERDEELRSITKKERELEKVIEKLKRENSDLRSSLNDEKVGHQVLAHQWEEEQDVIKAEKLEMCSKLKQARDEAALTKMENQDLAETISSMRTDIQRLTESTSKSHKTMDDQRQQIEELKDSMKREKRKNRSEMDLSLDRIIAQMQDRPNNRESTDRSKSRTRKQPILAVADGGSTDESDRDSDNENEKDEGEENSDHDEGAESEREVDRENDRAPRSKRTSRPSSAHPKTKEAQHLKPHELKALADSCLSWPEYRVGYDHSNFVERCERAAKKAIGRGVPKDHVALRLNVYIEKKIPECSERFDLLRGDTDEDPTLERTLEILRECEQDSYGGGAAQFLNTMQAPRESEDSFMERVKKRYDANIKAPNERERIRAIKNQFLDGLRDKPENFGRASVIGLSLEETASAARVMIQDEKSSRRLENRRRHMMNRRSAGGPLHVAAIYDEEDLDREEMEREMEKMAAEDAQKQVQCQAQHEPERAPTGKEFDSSVITCRICRLQNDHYSKDCKNAPFCSVCQCEGHSDEQHKAPNQSQGGRRGQGRGRSWPMGQNNFIGQNNNFNGQYNSSGGQSNNQNHFGGQSDNFNGRNGNNYGYGYGQNRNGSGYNNQTRYNNNGRNNGNNGGRNNGPGFGPYNNQNNARPYNGSQQNGTYRNGGQGAQNQQIKQEVKQEPQGAQGNAQGAIGGFEPAGMRQLKQENHA